MDLAAFFAEFAAASTMTPATQDFAECLAQFFEELPVIPSDQAVPDHPSPSESDLGRFFEQIKSPMEAVLAKGGLLNLWAIAGLKHNEVRTAGALAGLWRTEFGGVTSRDFLALYLKRAVKNEDWDHELCSGYSVFTEVNPLGESSDRVDLVIETGRYLIGIEIKIRAGLGPNDQLGRYLEALESRAAHMRRSRILILLAPFPSKIAEVYSSTWNDVSAAARQVAKRGGSAKSLIHRVIAQFGDHVAQH